MTGPDEFGSTVGFFTQWTGPDWDYLQWNSVEMEIVPSLKPTPLSLDLSYGDGNDRIQYQNYDPKTNPGDGAHIYEFIWTPNEVTFSVDGTILKSYQKGHPGVDNQTKSQNIMFNMWAPDWYAHTEDWSKGRDDSTMPWFAKCDYIEYHSWDADTDTFEHQWTEDFDTLDLKKWKVAQNEGFGENLATYMDTQVYAEDGQVVLKLDKTSHPSLFMQ